MMKNTEKTKVIFRRWKNSYWTVGDAGLIAIFPEMVHENSTSISAVYCSAWEHISGLCECHPETVMENTVPANTEEYIEDAKFLESQYGYNLEIIDSLPQDARDTRRASLQSFQDGNLNTDPL